jgi:preprotein translocase subunit SecB
MFWISQKSINMIPISPLQLRQHFFSLLSIRANPQGSGNAEPSLEPTIFFQKHSDDPSQWVLRLHVRVGSAKAEAPFLYDAEVEIHGLVEVSNGFAPEKREQLAVVNGLGLLYSAIREMVLTVTARSAHGGFCLPALNFVEIVSSYNAQQKAKEIAVTAPDPPTQTNPK